LETPQSWLGANVPGDLNEIRNEPQILIDPMDQVERQRWQDPGEEWAVHDGFPVQGLHGGRH
jgi:hypothetical protein